MNQDFPISMSEFLVKSVRSLTNKEIYKLLDEVLVNIDTFESFEKLVCLVFYIRDFFIGIFLIISFLINFFDFFFLNF